MEHPERMNRALVKIPVSMVFLVFLICAATPFHSVHAIADREFRRALPLEQRVAALEDASGHDGLPLGVGGVGFLFGAFCALWAQNTHRNPWLWFFVGLFFNVIAVLVLLYKNSQTARTTGA